MAWRLTKFSTQVVALAAHGSLVEAGWELSDVFVRVTGVLGLRGPRGRAENPRGLVLLLLCHHAVAVTMVVPMNANAILRTDRDYHELSFLLQAAAFVAGFSQLSTMRTVCSPVVGKGLPASLSSTESSHQLLYHQTAGLAKPVRSKEPKVLLTCGQPPKLGSP